MTQKLSNALLALALVAATPVPATAQGTAASPILHEEAKLLASDGAAYARFGHSVAISGETLVVGVHDIDSGGAYVFERDDTGAWAEVAKLLASDGEARDLFGESVAISGERLVVGAIDDDDLGTDSGSAYIFERDDTGTWAEVAKLLASDGAASDLFGYSVAISGERLVVGAYHDDDLGDQSGSAYVFERDDTGNWAEVAKLLASDGAATDLFGQSVAISGERLVVGARLDDDMGDQSGSAYVFERDDTGTWAEVAKLLASDGSSDDEFGVAVAISGEGLVVGAWEDDTPLQSFTGSAYVFERDDTGTWAEVAKLLASDGGANDFFGSSVAISGERLVVGADEVRFRAGSVVDDDDLGNFTGSAYVFERDDTGTWAEVAKLLASDGARFDSFGYSVAISGERLVVGASQDDDQGDESGSAYVFSLEACVLDLRLSPETVRAGENLEVAIHLEHNRLQTVTVPFLVWIEAADGRLIASRASEPRTFRHGDMAEVTLSVPLPADLPAGRYKVLVGVEKMQQGRAWAAAPFQVIEP